MASCPKCGKPIEFDCGDADAGGAPGIECSDRYCDWGAPYWATMPVRTDQVQWWEEYEQRQDALLAAMPDYPE